ncbi:unnamed protein product [Anisakis simplex]|uniref:ANK_REP_REGION domain-containing protein n=1 Tax=Anisakis simplex TaxID=6269 RepID=A0A0M3J678_ANISI|nr:unnamed protein product [Anisakis simplex]
MKFILDILCRQEKDRLKKLNAEQKTLNDKDGYKFLLVSDENNDSALHLACRGIDYKCVKVLLRVLIQCLGWQKVEKILSETNERGYAPIHIACMWRSISVVRLLLTSQLNKTIAKVCPFARTSRIANSLRNASLNALITAKLQTGSILHEMACSKACSRCACDAGLAQPNSDVSSVLCAIQGLPMSLIAEYEVDDMDLPDRKCMDCEKS